MIGKALEEVQQGFGQELELDSDISEWQPPPEPPHYHHTHTHTYYVHASVSDYINDILFQRSKPLSWGTISRL